MKFFDYKEIIPVKYIIPKKLIEEYKNFIEKSIPKKKMGRPRVDDDKLIAGIYYLLKTGCQWEALPLCFGSSKTVYHRFRELIRVNAFQKIWESALMQFHKTHGLELNHQAFDSCHKKSPLGGEKTGKSPVDRRKLGTKLNLATDGKGIPIGATIEKGNRHDSRLFSALLNNLQEQITQSKNHYLHTDKGYSSAKNKAEAFSNNYTPIMPTKKGRNTSLQNEKKDKHRWVIEQTFSWINRFRRVFVRYEKLQISFLSLVQFAFQIIIINKI